MADDPRDDPKLQAQNLELRVALSDAYAAVESRKTTQSFSALTFEDLLDKQIERLSGPGTSSRPNPIDRVQKVSKGIVDAVAQIKALPPETFAKPDDSRDVNPPT